MVKEIEEYYCDRCGEKIEHNDIFISRNCTTMMIKFKKMQLFRLGSEWYTIDLCEKCKDSFADWWVKK